MRPIVTIFVAVLLIALISGGVFADSPSTQNVVTVHNHTWSKVNFQARAKENGKWGKWYHYSAPVKGYYYFCFYGDLDGIQIRYDKILNDNFFTEQIYDVKYTVLRVFRKANHKDGEPYYFQKKSGTNILQLYHKK